MKIQVVSDLHLEHQDDNGVGLINSFNPEGVDALVVAGDLCNEHQLDQVVALLCSRFPVVIYVPGNHEYYDSGFKRVWKVLHRLNDTFKNLHLLERSALSIGSKHVLGTTLWFPELPDNEKYEDAFSDFIVINKLKDWVYRENRASVKYLEDNLQEGDVVITHHFPSYQSIGKRFVGDPFNRFFICSMEKLILERKPSLWIHGHTHDSFDYQLGDTRILCNPHGYTGHERNVHFKNNLVIDIESLSTKG